MGKKLNGLYLAIKRISEDGMDFDGVKQVFGQILWSTFLPVLLTMMTIHCLLNFYFWTRMRWFASASALHKEALVSYQRQSTNRVSYRRSKRKAKLLLERAIWRDPQYQPAYLSLAALYLYPPPHQSASIRDPDQALEVLANCRQNTSGGAERIRALYLDATAIQSGQGQMVLDGLMQDEFLIAAFARRPLDAAGSESFLSSSSSSLKDENKKSSLPESKKDN